jgi:hypothetical protein
MSKAASQTQIELAIKTIRLAIVEKCRKDPNNIKLEKIAEQLRKKVKRLDEKKDALNRIIWQSEGKIQKDIDKQLNAHQQKLDQLKLKAIMEIISLKELKEIVTNFKP